jgi:hypothetical protein
MPLEPEELTPDRKLFNVIEKVVIVKGMIPSDPTIWKFYIQDKVLRVDAAKLENMTQFRKEYLKVFDHPAPKVTPARWIAVLEALADEKATHIQAPEESSHVFIANSIFEIVCDREVSDDPDEAFSGFALYEHFFQDDEKPYCCVPSKVLLSLVEGAGFKIPLSDLSSTMTELGMKKEGTPRISYSNKQLRSWCFFKNAVLREKGEKLDD